MLENQLQTYFGFDGFKKGQKQVIEKILAGESAGAIFPTGAGKSLCYQLPAMLLPDMTLVVSPLLSLMKDQLDFLISHNIPAARLDSTLGPEETQAIFDKAKNGLLKILMISVERFKNERFRFHLQNMRISLLVVDEAHCISEWGHNFRPEYLNLPYYRQEFKIPQALLLTATATKQVADDMRLKFDIPEKNVIATGFYRENLYLQVTPCPASEKNTRLLQRIQKKPGAPTIVYVTLQKTAENVARFLCENHINAAAYHAGMQHPEREAIQNRFMDGSLSCVVATIAFGMGIDKRDIRRVIHYDLPKSIENYSQEIGRSGRDGELALCEVLADRDGIHILENFIYGDTPDKRAIRQVLQTIAENDGFIWEIKLFRLSSEVNIRPLPLKTLLVYLAMEGVIRPKFSYFEDYTFKYLQGPSWILDQFEGERKQFVRAVFDHCHTKKIWTSANISDILANYQTDRRRIITALEYFEEKGWIELQAGQTVEVYDILNQAVDMERMTETLHTLFLKKQTQEIDRIRRMVPLFESTSCISRGLAAYFGEILDFERCGHCAFCKTGPVRLPEPAALRSLSTFDFTELTAEFVQAAGEYLTSGNLAKFLCGIHTPVFMKLKARKMSTFGRLEAYPFMEVIDWISRHRKNTPEKTSID
ncbi:MAG: RecQ family ATP-dependent DNA helicase [Desulfobacteraceae bacterium]|nr:MAG: RecQ family ATP-dependent DNA helicase [Desulfobacteraceae bacterium]